MPMQQSIVTIVIMAVKVIIVRVVMIVRIVNIVTVVMIVKDMHAKALQAADTVTGPPAEGTAVPTTESPDMALPLLPRQALELRAAVPAQACAVCGFSAFPSLASRHLVPTALIRSNWDVAVKASASNPPSNDEKRAVDEGNLAPLYIPCTAVEQGGGFKCRFSDLRDIRASEGDDGGPCQGEKALHPEP